MTVRRIQTPRRGPVARRLSPREITTFNIGSGQTLYRTEAEGRALYELNRLDCLTNGNWGPFHCRPFWKWEPSVPDELRPQTGDVDGDDDTEWMDAYERRDDQDRARLQWLVNEGASLIRDLPDGVKLHEQLVKRIDDDERDRAHYEKWLAACHEAGVMLDWR